MTHNSKEKHASCDAGCHARQTPIPPPIPPPTFPNKSSTPLLSPWWLAEPAPEPQQSKKPAGRWKASYSKIRRLGEMNEHCLFLSRREDDPGHSGSAEESSTDRRMLCLSRQVTRPKEDSWNPLNGIWFVMATTSDRCQEHLAATSITKQSVPAYYATDLGEWWSQSGQNAKQMIQKTFSPLQHLSRRYLESWTDGTQATFFARFWASAKRGDAFQLMYTSTRRLIHASIKKEDDEKE